MSAVESYSNRCTQLTYRYARRRRSTATVIGSTIRIGFLCVENAGRSQIAAAFAERERAERGLTEVVAVHSAGTNPADRVHEVVGIDVADRTPTYVVLGEIKQSQFLIIMGCSIAEINPAHYGIEHREGDLTNPADEDVETVRAVRDEIEETANERAAQKNPSQRVSSAIKSAFPF